MREALALGWARICAFCTGNWRQGVLGWHPSVVWLSQVAEKCLITKSRARMTGQRKDSTQGQLAKPEGLLGVTKRRRGDSYRKCVMTHKVCTARVTCPADLSSHVFKHCPGSCPAETSEMDSRNLRTFFLSPTVRVCWWLYHCKPSCHWTVLIILLRLTLYYHDCGVKAPLQSLSCYDGHCTLYETAVPSLSDTKTS